VRYKFCHPLEAPSIDEVHVLGDGFLEQVAKVGENTDLIVDFKCLDVEAFPEDMLAAILNAFGARAIYSAAQPEILEPAHRLGARTLQYFREGIDSSLSFTPTFYVAKYGEETDLPREKTILYCPSAEIAFSAHKEGYGGVMVDGDKLL